MPASQDAVRPVDEARSYAPVLTVHPVFGRLWEVKVKETVDKAEDGESSHIEISVHEKPFKEVCTRSLGFLHVTSPIRLALLAVVEYKMFDHFILALICFNTVIMASQKYRDPCYSANEFGRSVDPWLLAVFTCECSMKIGAYGVFGNPRTKCPNTYLRDGWNWLDFVVVFTGLLSAATGTPGCDESSTGGLSFLRVFRAFRPLRSLTKSPKMKVIVNTVLLSIPKLGNVCLMAIFLMIIFGILGINFWGGVMFRMCRDAEQITALGGDGINPVLMRDADTYGFPACWAYPMHEASAGRMCGGEFMCEEGGVCMSSFPDLTGIMKEKQHPAGDACKKADPDGGSQMVTGIDCFAPSFFEKGKDMTSNAPYPWNDAQSTESYPWCDDFYALLDKDAGRTVTQMGGWWQIETDGYNFGRTNFNHILVALLVIFQCITMEGWVDVMYVLQDCDSYWFACVYFVLLFLLGSLFLLNIALAVVSEAFNSLSDEMNDGEDEEEDEDDQRYEVEVGDEVKVQRQEKLWCDHSFVRVVHKFQDSDLFQNTIMAFIVLNVVAMMLDKYPQRSPTFLDGLYTSNLIFTAVFAFEFFVLHVAFGLWKYWTGMMTLLDGCIVIVSFVELWMDMSGGGASFDLKPLRGFRLLRIFKLAKKWTSFRILVKSMLRTVKCMGHFLVLLILVLVVFSLMGMTFFGGQFRFADDLSDGHRRPWPDETLSTEGTRTLYCGSTGTIAGGLRDNCNGMPCDQGALDCVPRAHFDNFLWGIVTCFQILSGENWNTVMYDGMIAVGWGACVYFLMLVVAGQLIIFNLFLAILMEEFEKASEETRKEERSKTGKDEPSKPQSAFEDAGAAEGGGLAAVMAAAAKAEKEAAEKAAEEALIAWPCSYTFFVFSPHNMARVYSKRIVNWSVFDNFILVLIIISSLAMVLDNPLNDPGDDLPRTLKVLNWIFTAIFVSEMVFKKIAYGVLFGKDAYWRHGWNILDGIVVFVSLADVIMDLMGIGGKVSFFKTLRVLRALRPLRVISRNPNLKLVVNTLFKSVPELCNLLVVAGLFFLIFGLLFVNMLKGGFYTCMIPDGGEFGGYDYSPSMLPASVAVAVGAAQTVTAMTPAVITAFVEEHPGLKSNWMVDEKLVSTKQGCHAYCNAQVPRMVMQGFDFSTDACECAAQTSWMCIDANKTSNSYGAVWPVTSTWAAEHPEVALTLGGDCSAYLPSLRTWGAEGSTALPPPADESSVGGALPPPAREAGLKFWHRGTDDTPICEASCLGTATRGESSKDDIERPPGCPKHITVDILDADENVVPGGHAGGLPSVCEGTGVLEPGAAPERRLTPDHFYLQTQELVIPGRNSDFADEPYASWRSAGTRWLMPCGATSFTHDGVDRGDRIDGCRERFMSAGEDCPSTDENKEACQDRCRKTGGTDKPFFCTTVCDDTTNYFDEPLCEECRLQCVAQCQCDIHCEPYKLDAALCLEQGGYWENFHQHFDNIGQAMLTLIEIATTEGWVNVMYMATDYTGPMLTPKLGGDYETPMSLAFVFFMLLGSFFILNLCVGVIVDNFSRMKEDGGDILLTEDQKKWQETKKMCEQQNVLFGVTDLQRLPPRRRQAFFIVRDNRFETIIMTCILLNTLVMGLKQFPAPTEPWYGDVERTLNYFFAGVFLCECVLKLYVLRWTYYKDNWNVFDFVCVCASLFGIMADAVFNLSLGPVMSGIRLFRIARLFRLLRFAKGLNKLFNAFLLSIPKLLNVAMILALLLFLFSVMGVAMFANVHYHGPHSVHANFRTFPAAIMTLLRCMTGEGWNEMMHSMMKTSIDFGRMQQPCVDNLDITVENWPILEQKCIIDNPLKCGSSELGVFFFIAYTCVMTFVILNLFVAVVLEGFDGSSVGDHEAVISKCIEVWQRYDKNLTMKILHKEVIKFISEVNQELADEGGSVVDNSLRTNVRHKILSRMDIIEENEAKYVDFKSAVQGALCLNMINESENPDEMMKKIDEVDDGSRQQAEKYSVEFVQKIFRERARKIKAARVTEPDGSPGPMHPSRRGGQPPPADGAAPASGAAPAAAGDSTPAVEPDKGTTKPPQEVPQDPPVTIPGACDVEENIPVAG